jgi:hypothetical protein
MFYFSFTYETWSVCVSSRLLIQIAHEKITNNLNTYYLTCMNWITAIGSSPSIKTSQCTKFGHNE